MGLASLPVAKRHDAKLRRARFNVTVSWKIVNRMFNLQKQKQGYDILAPTRVTINVNAN